MGMTIDNAISDLIELKICGVVPFTKGTISGGNYKVITGDCLDAAIDTMRKYQKMQADYENRLKADMVAMLEELDLTIDEIPIVTRHGVTGTVMTAQGMRKKIKENIQQKINALKGERT